jgi:hypothetical protein
MIEFSMPNIRRLAENDADDKNLSPFAKKSQRGL